MPRIDLKALAARLRAARLVAGYDTRAAAAEAAGVSVWSLTEYEAARNAPRVQLLVQLADAYGVGLYWLLGVPEWDCSAMEQAADGLLDLRKNRL